MTNVVIYVYIILLIVHGMNVIGTNQMIHWVRLPQVEQHKGDTIMVVVQTHIIVHGVGGKYTCHGHTGVNVTTTSPHTH